ncbi:MAG: hypothetical protein CMI02_18315 [Oceanospirillaceae bacterium]|nr:hypothetical protein [Oceanospirillaceae bacterium]MBT13980.1 hypothetical protein [Oceanospirillaceae bacterium]|tara:strand:- start:4955 stop:7789 length:2835 start_codon:yes stop_codon:yes gene_type:complete
MADNKTLTTWLRRFSIFLACLLALILVLLYLAPAVAIFAADRWYQKQGEGYQLLVEDWQFSPFKTYLRLDGVRLEHPQQGTGSTEINRLVLSLDPWALLDQHLSIGSVELDGLRAAPQVQLGDAAEKPPAAQADASPALTSETSAEITAQEPAAKESQNTQSVTASSDSPQQSAASDAESSVVRIAGLRFPAADGTDKQPEDNTPPEAEAQNQTMDNRSESSAASAWQVSVDQLLLSNDRLQWDVRSAPGSALQSSSGNLTIEKIQLNNFTTTQETPVDVVVLLSVETRTSLADSQLTVNQPLNLSVHGSLATPLTAPHWQGNIRLSDTDISYDDIRAALSGLDITLDADVSEGFSQASVSLTTALTAADVRDGASDTRATLQKLNIQLEGQLLDDLSRPDFHGDLQLSGLDVVYQSFHSVLGSLAVDGIQATREEQAFKQLVMQNLQVEGGAAQSSDNSAGDEIADSAAVPLAALEYYRTGAFSFSPQSLTLGEQDFHSLMVSLHKQADGHLQGLALAGEDKPAETAAADESAADGAGAAAGAQHPEKDPQKESQQEAQQKTQPGDQQTEQQTLAFILNGLQQLSSLPQPADGQSGTDKAGEDEADTADPSEKSSVISRLNFRDDSVTPALMAQMSVYELTVSEINGQLDNSQPALNKAVNLHLLAGLDEYNRIKADTALSLYQRDGAVYPQGSIKGKITQLDLTAFNGYLANAMGYHLERGMLEADIDVQIDKARLSGEIKLLLRNSRFVPVDEATIDRVSKQISMPVDTALDLLRDDNGNVRVTIPVSGDLTDPDVGLNDLTQQLSVLALKTGAMYYLKQALQPYTTLINLASFAGDYLMEIRLDALQYETGASALTEDHQKNLQKVAGLMEDKQSLELQVCPFVSSAEAESAGDDWPELAQQRGAEVKAWINAQNESLTPRVTVCKPQQGDNAEVVLGFN